MKMRLRSWWFQIVAAGFFLVALLIYGLVVSPLIRKGEEIDREIEQYQSLLEEGGFGGNLAEIEAKIGRLEGEIEVFSKIAGDRLRTIQFPPEIASSLGRSFQLIDYERRKFGMIEVIREMAGKEKAKLFDEWESAFPSFNNQSPYRIWGELTLSDQLFRTAIIAGVKAITIAEFIDGSEGGEGIKGGNSSLGEEVSIRMRVVGEMKAIDRLIKMLPLNGEELDVLGYGDKIDEKSAFFISRFILRKNSTERANEVEFDFVASGFLNPIYKERREGR